MCHWLSLPHAWFPALRCAACAAYAVASVRNWRLLSLTSLPYVYSAADHVRDVTDSCHVHFPAKYVAYVTDVTYVKLEARHHIIRHNVRRAYTMSA